MSRRQYAEGNRKALQRIFTEGADLVYYAQRNVLYPPGLLLVDYDLAQLELASTASARCAELRDLSGPYQSIVFNLPRFVPFWQTEVDVCAASNILRSSGRLTMVVPARSGRTRLCRILSSAFGRVERASKRPEVLTCWRPLGRTPEPYANEIRYFDPELNQTLSFFTRPGLFSADEIDPGTRLLLDVIEVSGGQRVLDVGCGYGAIGVVAGARGGEVHLLECDCRALGMAERNLKRNRVLGTALLAASLDRLRDCSFDLVLSNPPTHAGSTLLQSLFRGMVRICRPQGQVVLVVREHLNYEKWLRCLGEVQVVASRDGFKILQIA